MRVLLVQPWLGRDQHPVLPIGLATIASSLKEHQVRLLDLNIGDNIHPFDRLSREISAFQPQVTGFSLRNCDTTSYHDPFSYLPPFFQQLRLTADAPCNTRIVVGGSGFSVFPGEIMSNCREISCGVTGHGEVLVKDVVEKGLSGMLHGSAGVFNLPDFDLVDVSAYSSFQSNLSLGVEVSRGCSERCSYCSYPKLSGSRVHDRPLTMIRQDIDALRSNGIRHFFLIAPVLNHTEQRGLEIAGLMGDIGSEITWESYQTPVGFSFEYASRLAASGCTAVSFSPDAGTDRQLRTMGKKYSVRHIEKAIEAASENGIQVSLNVFPWNTESCFREMLLAFRNGSRWGSIAGDMLRRLRFSLVRRMPETAFQPAEPAFSSVIGLPQFCAPAGAAGVAFRVLKKLLERGT